MKNKNKNKCVKDLLLFDDDLFLKRINNYFSDEMFFTMWDIIRIEERSNGNSFLLPLKQFEYKFYKITKSEWVDFFFNSPIIINNIN